MTVWAAAVGNVLQAGLAGGARKAEDKGAKRMVTPNAAISEMAERIRRAIDPDRIILFGSRARGGGGPQSDYDLLIVAPSPLPRWRRTAPLYRLLAGVGVPKDIVWWTPEEVDEWRCVRSHFISTAVREGRVLYEKSA